MCCRSTSRSTDAASEEREADAARGQERGRHRRRRWRGASERRPLRRGGGASRLRRHQRGGRATRLPRSSTPLVAPPWRSAVMSRRKGTSPRRSMPPSSTLVGWTSCSTTWASRPPGSVPSSRTTAGRTTERLSRRELRWCLQRLQASRAPVQGPGRWRGHLEHRFGRRPGGLGRRRSTAPPRERSTSSPRRWPSRPPPSTSACNAICPAGMPFTNFFAAGGRPAMTPEEQQQAAAAVGASHPLGRPITAEDCAAAAVFLCSEARGQHHRGAAPHRRRVRRTMTRLLDIAPVRELFDLEGSYLEMSGGAYRGDPYPRWHSAARQRTGPPWHRPRPDRPRSSCLVPWPARGGRSRTSASSPSKPATLPIAIQRSSPPPP